MGSRNLWLDPPPGGKKTARELLGANKTVSTSFSPRASLAIYTTPATIRVQHSRQSPVLKKETHPIWFAQWDTVEPYRREFVTQSFFVSVKYRESVRRIIYTRPKDLLSNKSIALYAETCQSYIDIIQRLLQKNKEAKPELRMNENEQALFEALFPALDLFQIVYMPSHGYLNALIARELLAWLNSNFPIRSEELGMLLNIEAPWEALNFWDFIKHCALRCVLEPVSLLLGTVSEKHPSVPTREVTSLVLRTIMNMPNLENFQHDLEFYDEHRLWKTGLHKVRRECAKHKDARYEGKADLEEMLCLLEGNTKTLYEICERTGGGFREAVCVWGIWINEGLSREQLPDVTAAVLADMPMDSTSMEDVLHAALLKKEAAKVASTANDLDLWLAAHITDLMLPLQLPESSVLVGLRRHFILAYAESILSDPWLWRMAVEYMVTCDEIGLQTAREVLLRVPLRILESAPQPITASDEAASSNSHLEDLLEVCDEHDFQDTKAYICRTASRMFATRKEYGRAIDYCARTLDIVALTRVVNLLLDDYLEQGSEAFITLVDGISAHLLYPDLPGAPPAPFGETLRFVVRYAEFHHTRLEGRRADAAGELTDLFGSDLVPRSWWGLLLVDAAELLSSEDDMILTINEVHTLLARLEEISAKESFGQGSAGEYLVALRRRTKLDSDAEALERLESVRLNFVRYASKCMMSGIGGEGSLLDTPMVM